MSDIIYVRAGPIYSDSRSTKEILALAEAGHSVRVVGWDRTGRASAECAAAFKAYADRISFVFFSQDAEREREPGNISEIYEWSQFVTDTLEKDLADAEWVHACDLEAGWPALRVCERFGRKLVYDIFDYCADSRPLPPEVRGIAEKMETAVIDFAYATVICTEERKEQIQKARPHKLVVIHNSPDVSGILPDPAEVWDYAYCGALTADRLIGEILTEYQYNRDLHFVFAGEGRYRALAERYAKEGGSFLYKGRIPYAEVLEIESRSRVLSAVYSPAKRNHRLCAPNKFYEALALGRPVIVCRGTGIDRIVEEKGIGAVIHYDAGEFYEALYSLLSDQKKREEMGTRARRIYESKYRWSMMKERLIRIYMP